MALALVPFFKDLFVLFDSFNKLSLNDSLFASIGNNSAASLTLLDAFITDTLSLVSVRDLKLAALYQSDFQNLITSIHLNAPELLLTLSDYLSTYRGVLGYNVSQVYNYTDQSHFLEVSGPIHAVSLICTLWVLVLLFSTQSRNVVLGKTSDTYFAKFVLYIYSIVKDNRVQLEAGIVGLTLFVFYYAILLIGFSEVLNYSTTHLSTLLVVVFVGSYITFLFKNSIHYFSFLEATVTDKSLMGYAVQFLKDSSNSIAIILRFLTLLVRLNLYDLVDDILDSNYIFFCDFEEERFLADSISSFNKGTQWLDTLNYRTHDRINGSYPLLVLSVDLYSLFFLM